MSRRVIGTTWLIASLTLFSRMLGLLRECLFGYFFSTSEVLSAFRIAFMMPNLARRLFGEGALSSALIPVLTKSLLTNGEESSRRFVGTLLTLLGLFLTLAVVAAEAVIAVWRTFEDDPALVLTAILLPYMVLICAVAVAGGVLNVRGRFAIPAAVPALLNLAIIVGVLIGAMAVGLTGIELMYLVCASVLIGGVAQLLVTGAGMRAASFFPSFGIARDPRVRTVALLMAPMVVGLSAVQINAVTDYLIAYLFIRSDQQRVGPAVLGYAQFLYQLPLGVFGIALATAMFPVLSEKAARGDRAGLADALSRGLRMNLFIALPASVGLMFVAHPLVATLYERGAFDAGDTSRVAGTLFFYSIGLTAYFSQHILVRSFYAMHDSRTPARIALMIVGVNLGLNLLLVFVMEERGLALATALCAVIQVAWLARRLAVTLMEIDWRSIGRAVLGMLVATAAMAAVLAVLVVSCPAGTGPPMRLAVFVAGGVLTYGLAARGLRIDELDLVLKKRL